MIFFLCLAMATQAGAAEYFVDPAGPQNGSGSRESPFASIKLALASNQITDGDQLTLLGGEYGAVLVKGAIFDSTVQIVASPGERVHFEALMVKNSSNVYFSGILVWPSNPEPSEGSMVETAGNASSIVFDNMDIRSAEGAGQYRSWGVATWLAVKRRAVLLRGTRNTIKNSQVTGAFIGISAIGDFALISGNRISGFSGDALRALGDYSLVTGNYVEDCIKINKNHDDGFQSWSRGPNGKTGRGTVRGLTIENNVILEWNGTDSHPLRCTLQGIGLFDGLFESLTIQNNVVSVTAYHGISVAGGRDSRIVNNTVINATGVSDRQPWISVAAHKNGSPSQRVVVANNAAMAFRMPPEISATATGNFTMSNPTRVLNDPFGNDFRPRPGGALDGRGSADYAPATDILGNARPQGGKPEIGAFEIQ